MEPTALASVAEAEEPSPLLSFFSNACNQMLDDRGAVRRELARVMPALLSLVADDRVAQSPVGMAVQQFIDRMGADNRKASATTGVVRCGWLGKPSGSGLTTHRRWVVLDGTNLMYFRDRGETDLRGVVQLRGARVQRQRKLFSASSSGFDVLSVPKGEAASAPAAAVGPVHVTAALNPLHEKKTKYTFLCSSPAARDAWVVAIQQAIDLSHAEVECTAWGARFEAAGGFDAYAGALVEFAARHASLSLSADWVRVHMASAKRALASAGNAHMLLPPVRAGHAGGGGSSADKAAHGGRARLPSDAPLVTLPVDSAVSSSSAAAALSATAAAVSAAAAANGDAGTSGGAPRKAVSLSVSSPLNHKLARLLSRRKQVAADMQSRVDLLPPTPPRAGAAGDGAGFGGARPAHPAHAASLSPLAPLASSLNKPRVAAAGGGVSAASPAATLAAVAEEAGAAAERRGDEESSLDAPLLAGAEREEEGAGSHRAGAGAGAPASPSPSPARLPAAERRRAALLQKAASAVQLRDEAHAAVAAAEMSAHRRRAGYTPGDRVSVRQLGRDTQRDVLVLDGAEMANWSAVALTTAVMCRLVDVANACFRAWWRASGAAGAGAAASQPQQQQQQQQRGPPSHLLLCSPREALPSSCNARAPAFEQQLVEFCREVLLCTSRTVLGGDTFDAVEAVFRNPARALLRPDTDGPTDPVVLTVEVLGRPLGSFLQPEVSTAAAAAAAGAAAAGTAPSAAPAASSAVPPVRAAAAAPAIAPAGLVPRPPPRAPPPRARQHGSSSSSASANSGAGAATSDGPAREAGDSSGSATGASASATAATGPLRRAAALSGTFSETGDLFSDNSSEESESEGRDGAAVTGRLAGSLAFSVGAAPPSLAAPWAVEAAPVPPAESLAEALLDYFEHAPGAPAAAPASPPGKGAAAVTAGAPAAPAAAPGVTCAADMLRLLSIRVSTRMRYRLVAMDEVPEAAVAHVREQVAGAAAAAAAASAVPADSPATAAVAPPTAAPPAALAGPHATVNPAFSLLKRSSSSSSSSSSPLGASSRAVPPPSPLQSAAAAPGAVPPGHELSAAAYTPHCLPHSSELCLVYALFGRAFPWQGAAQSAAIQLRLQPFADDRDGRG